ncbi:MAG: (2Fe-2S)-binding protein [Candidatus Izemoplasma sp.]
MEKDILCCCHNVSLEDMKEQVKLGVSSFKDLQDITKIGTDCAPCKEKNELIFNKLINEK